jgi:hypothetical protein
MEAGKLSEVRREDKQLIDLLQLLLNQEEFHS